MNGNWQSSRPTKIINKPSKRLRTLVLVRKVEVESKGKSVQRNHKIKPISGPDFWLFIKRIKAAVQRNQRISTISGPDFWLLMKRFREAVQRNHKIKPISGSNFCGCIGHRYMIINKSYVYLETSKPSYDRKPRPH